MTKARDLSNLANGVPNSLISLDSAEIPNLDASKITTGELANARVADLPASKITSGTIASARIDNNSLSAITSLPSGVGGTAWQSVQTSGFTAVAGRGYPCNTTSSAFTVTLPASATAGDTIQIVDYAGTFDTNKITLGRNGNKIEGATSDKQLSTERKAVQLVYIDATQGWLVSAAANETATAIEPLTYSVDFLVIAGGGSGGYSAGAGGGAGGYRNSYSTETSGGGGSSEASLSFAIGTVCTITVGAGGASATTEGPGNPGNNSSISGTGITTITSTGGGRGGRLGSNGGNGGSGGGGGGLGTANQGFNGGNTGNGGGGGGAAEAGNTDGGEEGGDGLSSSITGSAVSRAGGGGGASSGSSTGGGGGDGQAGTANTGSGGGRWDGNTVSGAGGSGVVILRMPTANYSTVYTGTPTVQTSGADTILIFNGSGSYTG